MTRNEDGAVISAKPQAATELDPDRPGRESDELFEAETRPAGPAIKPAEMWFFVELLRRRWVWLLAGGLLSAVCGLALASKHWKSCFVASARIIRVDSARASQVFAFQTLTPQTYVTLLKSPELLARVAENTFPAMSADEFTRRLRLTAEHDGDVVLVETSAVTKQGAADLANRFVRDAIGFTKELQSRAADEVKRFIQPQLEGVDSEMASWKSSKPASLQPAPSPAQALPQRPSTLALKLQAAREELVDDLTRYTELHPTVHRAKAKVQALERMVAEEKTKPDVPSEAEVADRLALQREARETLRSHLAPLEATRRDLEMRLRAAELVAADPPGYYRELQPATLKDVKSTKREVKIGSVAVLAGVCGVLAVVGLTLLVEVLDRRLKAPADVKRVTDLSVLACAPDLTDRSSADRANWAFRTWITLQGRLSPALNHGLVCGLTSAGRGEGRSTWIKLLARAASECGYRVLTVTAEHGLPASEVSASAPPAPKPNGHLVPSVNGSSGLPSVRDLEHKLVGPESQRVVQIPLPGWVWNLERRKQWQCALKEWQHMGNVVILVELPPASVPETVLLAQELPNLLWLTDSARSEAAETRAQLETLRNARCRLVGAVLNRAPLEHVRTRFARWMPCAPTA